VVPVQGGERRRQWLGFISMAQQDRRRFGTVALSGVSRNGGAVAGFLGEEDGEYLG
jgi:hypothetical protein